jgi:hypothetical protein
MVFNSYLFFIVPICFIGIGCFLVYFAFSGKGITEPEKNAPFLLHSQYWLGGLVRGGLILFGLLSFLKFVNEFL